MEKSKNKALIDFFKNIGATLGKILASDADIDNDVELPAELSGDPIVALNDFQSSQATVQSVTKTRTRASQTKTKTTKTRTTQAKTTKNLDTDELDR